MLREAQFDFERPMTGLEIELNLVDEDGEPANVNAEVLARIADPAFQTEMAQFNMEINVAPRELGGTDVRRAGDGGAGQPELRRRAGARLGRADGDDRDPADADAAST